MRDKPEPKIKRIMSLVEKLPYFSLDDLAAVEKDKVYLKILFSRYEKTGKVIRLKKGLYVAERHILSTLSSRRGADGEEAAAYYEFLANILCQPSYLSLEYILCQHNILTELPVNFTSAAKNKTTHFSNKLGNFLYHKVKEELFCGFEIIKKANFTILQANKSKALFDFLYLRKNLLINKTAIKELRLNLDCFNKNDIAEFKQYLVLEKSEKMREIFKELFR